MVAGRLPAPGFTKPELVMSVSARACVVAACLMTERTEYCAGKSRAANDRDRRPRQRRRRVRVRRPRPSRLMALLDRSDQMSPREGTPMSYDTDLDL